MSLTNHPGCANLRVGISLHSVWNRIASEAISFCCASVISPRSIWSPPRHPDRFRDHLCDHLHHPTSHRSRSCRPAKINLWNRFRKFHFIWQSACCSGVSSLQLQITEEGAQGRRSSGYCISVADWGWRPVEKSDQREYLKCPKLYLFVFFEYPEIRKKTGVCDFFKVAHTRVNETHSFIVLYRFYSVFWNSSNTQSKFIF